MWVNQLKEQRKHRICKSQLSHFHWHDSFTTNMMLTWTVMLLSLHHNAQQRQLQTIVQHKHYCESRSINLELKDAAI